MTSNSVRIIDNFADWKRLLEAVAAPAGEDLVVKPFETEPVLFNFKFQQGQWAETSVDQVGIEQIKKDIGPMISSILQPGASNVKYVLELTASTSKSPVGKALIDQLASAGYKADAGDTTGNSALCKARLATMSKIVKREIASALRVNPDEPAFAEKFKITTVSKPNAGGSEKPADPANVQWQYIAFKLSQSGERLEKGRVVTCNMPYTTVNGGQAGPENNYVGYEASYFIQAQIGKAITLKLNSISIPDAFYVKYGDFEYLSPFVGQRTQPRWNKTSQEKLDSGKATLADLKKTNERNFVLELAELTDLQAKIDAKIASVGGKLTCEGVTLGNSKAWQNGKPVVYVMPQQQPSIPLTRTFFEEEFKLIVFSPLGDTRFSIASVC